MQVILLSGTPDPIRTLFNIYNIGRQVDYIPSEDALPPREDMERMAQDIMKQNMPPTQMISLVFAIKGISIALREQLVRHRIGHQFAGYFNMGYFPDIANSSFWSQSMRVLDMRDFASQKKYVVPDTIADNDRKIARNSIRGGTIEDFYRWCIGQTAWWYKILQDSGIPGEDARMILPMGATHDLVWATNLAAIQHIMPVRMCWIAQMSIWKPLILGILEELEFQYGEFFHSLRHPPCIKSGCYGKCPYSMDNINRLTGKDPELPCPLFMNYEGSNACNSLRCIPEKKWGFQEKNNQVSWLGPESTTTDRMIIRLEDYQDNIWKTQYIEDIDWLT